MFIRRPRWCMLVTVSITGIFKKAVRVTLGAFTLYPAVVQGEGVRQVVLSRNPGWSIVTPVASRPKAAVMDIVLAVAGVAGSRRPGIDTSLVTGVTGNTGVGSGERKGGHTVVYGRRNPGWSIVTPVASRPHVAVMDIVLAVAGVAGSRRPAIDTSLVTGATGKTGVGSRERKSGHIVVYARRNPGWSIVAPVASRPQAAVMDIVLAVARVAVGRGGIEAAGMAIGAGGNGMSPGNGIGRLVVVKVNLHPVPGIVTSSALGGRSLVFVVLAVAGVAVGRSGIEAASMAIGAGSNGMSPGNGIGRLVVVKLNLHPIPGVVTLSALGGRSLVFVVLAVARVAVGRGGVEAAGMAIRAGNHRMASGKSKTGLVMVKDLLEPVTSVVALGAVLSGAASMLIILSVARITVLRGFLERLDGLCPLMTVPTRQERMLPLQGEGGFIMTEIRTVGFDAVVTFHTPYAECIHMDPHESRFPILVTGVADRLLNNVYCHRVTVNTGESQVRVTDLVTAQREAAFFPGEVFLCYQGQRGIRAFVLGVAVLNAAPRLTHRKHAAV